MSIEESKSIISRYFQAWNAGDVSALETIVDPGYVDHSAAPGTPTGLEGEGQFLRMVRTAFPDAEWTVEDVVAEGDRAAVRVTFRGTHEGDFLGIPPTHKSVAMLGIGIMRFGDGKLVESWISRDRLSLMQQLGRLPAS